MLWLGIQKILVYGKALILSLISYNNFCCDIFFYKIHLISYSDDVCVLSASGTAALIHTNVIDDVFAADGIGDIQGDFTDMQGDLPCVLCHVPYAETSIPFRVNLHRCGVCRQVPKSHI